MLEIRQINWEQIICLDDKYYGPEARQELIMREDEGMLNHFEYLQWLMYLK
jgi:hypothetical protein